MNIKHLSFLIGFILVLFGGTVQADCFKSASLGEYPLGEWSDANRTWVVTDTVGSFSDAVTTLSALQTQKDTLINQCSTKGKAVITEVEKRLTERKAGIAAKFDRTCDNDFICPMIRDISIQSQEEEVDREIGRMQAWFEISINRCKGHFNYAFNILSPRICS